MGVRITLSIYNTEILGDILSTTDSNLLNNIYNICNVFVWDVVQENSTAMVTFE